MTDRDDRITRALLKQEIEDFLYREADLLDERHYDEWLALLTEDVRYWMPMRRNGKLADRERGVPRGGPRHQLVRRGQGDPDPPRAADPDRHPLGRGAGLAHLAPPLQHSARRGQSVRGGARRGLCQMPLSGLPQPGRDRDRHPGRQARGFAT